MHDGMLLLIEKEKGMTAAGCNSKRNSTMTTTIKHRRRHRIDNQEQATADVCAWRGSGCGGHRGVPARILARPRPMGMNVVRYVPSIA